LRPWRFTAAGIAYEEKSHDAKQAKIAFPKPKIVATNFSDCGLNRHAWSVNWRFLPEAWGHFLSVTPQTQWTHSPFRTTRRNISTAVGLQERCWLLLGMFMSYSGGLGCGIVSRINVSATFDATC